PISPTSSVRIVLPTWSVWQDRSSHRRWAIASWRRISQINIPIGIVGILLALKLVHREPPPRVRPGLATNAVGRARNLRGFHHPRPHPGQRTRSSGSAARSPQCFCLILHRLTTAAPLVQLEVPRVQTLRITVTAGSLYRMVITAVPFLLLL